MKRSPLLSMLLVIAVGAALWAAGTAGNVRTDEPDALSDQRVTRSLACVPGLNGGEAVVGSLQGEVSGDRDIRRGVVDLSRGDGGFVLTAGVGASASTYASQYAASGRWFAAQPCGAPSRQHWFMGAGGSRLHHSALTVSNTRSGEAVFDVRVFGPKGELDVPGLRGLSVRKEPLRLDLAEVAPSVDQLAVSVTAVRGLVSVSMVDEWAPTAAGKQLTEFAPGQAEAGTDLVLGGLPDDPARATLSLFNTGESATVVDVQLIGRNGTFASTTSPTVTVAPGELVQVPVPSAGRQGASGLRLRSSEPVVAGVRSVADRDVVLGPVLGALGDGGVVGVPRGAKGRLRLFNPDEGAAETVTVEFIDAGGTVVDRREVEVPPGSAVPVAPTSLRKGAVRAVRVLGGGDLRGVLEVNDGGLAVLPVSSITGETRVPAVRPRS